VEHGTVQGRRTGRDPATTPHARPTPDRNLSQGKQTDPTPADKAILITIDDADQVFRAEPDIVPIAERIAHHGPTAGFGLIIVTSDTTPNSFGGSPTLREALHLGQRGRRFEPSGLFRRMS
jgi:hypothetical protein